LLTKEAQRAQKPFPGFLCVSAVKFNSESAQT